MKNITMTASALIGLVFTTSLTIAEETPTYRYVTVPYRLDKFSEGNDLARFKLCGIGNWKVETSGFPERLKEVTHVVMRTGDAIATTGGACDFALVRWDILKHRKWMQESIDSRGAVDIPSLTKK